MSRKNKVLFSVILLIIMSFGLIFQSIPSHAQAASSSTPEDFPVGVKLTGTITALTSKSISLDDGSTVTVNKATEGLDADIKVGVLVTISAEVDDEELVAKSISLGQPTDDVAAPPQDSTPEATAVATTSSPEKNNGKGKGNDNQGNDNQGNNGKGPKDKGKDDSKGQGNSNKNNKDKQNDKGKPTKEVAACLANLKHPVALRLATLLDLSYTEIMTWHCNGVGFGEMTRAHLVAKKLGMTIDQVLALRKGGKGWGKILHDASISPSDLLPQGFLHGKGKGKGHGSGNGNTDDDSQDH
jgi:hypothetical protein